MDIPRYTYRTNETVSVNKPENQIFIDIVLIILILCVIINCFIFSKPPYIWICLLSFVSCINLENRKKRIVSPTELNFYDTYVVICREIKYSMSKAVSREYVKFFYHDITNFEYDCCNKRVELKGKAEVIWFDYKKDGTLSDCPDMHKIVNDRPCYFYINDNDTDNILHSIENFSSKKVIVKNNPKVSQ